MTSWLRGLPGVRLQEPLSRHSWYGIGGPAEYFLELSDDGEMAGLVRRLSAEGSDYRVIGAGSNTLFADEGVRGLTIKITTQCLRIDDGLVSVCAGYLMPKLAMETAKAGLSGLEFGAGVPGTVGGSVFGNAGAFGTEIKDRLVTVDAIDRAGDRRSLSAADCGFAYRESAFKRSQGMVISAATFRVTRDSAPAIRERIRQVQKHRRDTQPIHERSLGSTFKNPPGDSAGRLIEASGPKGHRIGRAEISPRHANFIVNLGGARASDVLALVAEMRERVKARFGVELEPEIQVMA